MVRPNQCEVCVQDSDQSVEYSAVLAPYRKHDEYGCIVNDFGLTGISAGVT